MLTSENLRAALGEFLTNNPGNRLESGDRIYDEPLVGTASAHDPYFLEFTRPEVIGDVFRVPTDWLDGEARSSAKPLDPSDTVQVKEDVSSFERSGAFEREPKPVKVAEPFRVIVRFVEAQSRVPEPARNLDPMTL